MVFVNAEGVLKLMSKLLTLEPCQNLFFLRVKNADVSKNLKLLYICNYVTYRTTTL